MRTAQRPQASVLTRVLVPAVFLVSGLAAFAWFFYGVAELLATWNEPLVRVDKAAFYFFGVGLGLLALALVMVWEQWLTRDLTRGIKRLFSRVAVASIIALVLLPQVVHWFADRDLVGRLYSKCDSASHQWLLFQEFVYVKAPAQCEVEAPTSERYR